MSVALIFAVCPALLSLVRALSEAFYCFSIINELDHPYWQFGLANHCTRKETELVRASKQPQRWRLFCENAKQMLICFRSPRSSAFPNWTVNIDYWHLLVQRIISSLAGAECILCAIWLLAALAMSFFILCVSALKTDTSIQYNIYFESFYWSFLVMLFIHPPPYIHVSMTILYKQQYTVCSHLQCKNDQQDKYVRTAAAQRLWSASR